MDKNQDKTREDGVVYLDMDTILSLLLTIAELKNTECEDENEE